jgi:hypothetical protein
VAKALNDPWRMAVAEQFFRVIGLLDPPPALMRPSVVARALRPAA